jgi:glutaredoxin
MKRSLWLISILLSLSLTTSAGAAIYRWIDGAGVVHYGDVPVPDADKLDESKFASEATADAALPYETRRAMLNFPVTLYVGNGCEELCDTARAFLQKRGIPFAERTLRSRDEIAAFTKLTGKNIVPSLAVGRTFVSGYEETLWNNELSFAGYPKTAPYRPASAVPVRAEQAPDPETEITPAASAVPEVPETQ